MWYRASSTAASNQTSPAASEDDDVETEESSESESESEDLDGQLESANIVRLAKAKRDTSEGQGLGSRLVWVSFDIAREKGTMLVLVGAYRPYDGHPMDPRGEQFDADARALHESFPEN
jgi:hypothetical protein